MKKRFTKTDSVQFVDYRWMLVISSCLFHSCLLLFGCKEAEDEEDKYPLLEGVWCSTTSGISTKITIFDNNAFFLFFEDDYWKDQSDAGKLKQWDVLISDIKYKNKDDFTCLFHTINNEKIDAKLTISANERSFLIKTDNYEGTWYKQSSYLVKPGSISFWTARNWSGGSLSIKLFDNNFDFNYNPLNEGGFQDKEKYDQYVSLHLIENNSLRYYVESGYPGCGGNGTAGFYRLPYGYYKYRVENGNNKWTGTINLNSDCVLIQIK